MKKNIIFSGIAFLTAIITSCTTIPGPVSEKYLVEKTDAETKQIEALETDIIKRHKSKLIADEAHKDSISKVKSLESEIALLEKENAILKDQFELYNDKKDAVNAEKKKAQLLEAGNKLARKKAELNYAKADEKMKEKTSEFKAAELALSVAELNYVKSKIAESYRGRNEPVKKEESSFEFIDKLRGKDKNDPYGYKKYKTFYEKQKKAVIKAEKEQKKAGVDLKAAETELSRFK